jgi:hypothetical protein
VVPTIGEEGADKAPLSYDEFKAMADREFNHARELSQHEAVLLWGQNWFPGNIAVKWNQILPDGSRGNLVWIPAGGTASVFRPASRGASLVSHRGPTVFVLPDGHCLESRTLNLCVSGGGGN